MRSLIAAPLQRPGVWIGLAWNDIVQNYRRTFLGPFWITLNLAIFAAAMTLVYGALFGVPAPEYGGYVVCGMIAWSWVSVLLTEVGSTFINYSAFLKSTAIDKSLFVWASAYKNVINLAHHLIVYFVLILFGLITPTASTLLAIPAFLVMFLFSIPVTAMAAILFTRYRDLQRLVGSTVILLLMVTPIFWQPTMITGWRTAFIYLNPIHYLVDFVRDPLLGKVPDPLTVTVVLGMTVLVWILGSLFYRRYERYVAFWI